MERIAGIPGKLVFDRPDGHHDTTGGYVECMGTDRPILKASQAAEVARKIALVHRRRFSRNAEMAPQREELLPGAVGALVRRQVYTSFGVELGPGEASPALLGGELQILSLCGHEWAVAV